MNSLGIYFGPKVISIAETKGSRLINHVQLPQSTISSADLEEKAPDEVKLVEIIALFKDELRKNKIDAKRVNLCLSGKDLIIRNFEMPLLPREELQNAINFEAKKYIPFKVEDLVSDFQLEYDKLSRTNFVIFMGIKKDTLDRYISIIKQLNMKISTVEYSAFSLLRILKLAGVGGKGTVGLVAVDLVGEDEAVFVVLENGLPLFSRDITLSGEPGDFMGPMEIRDTNAIVEKLRTEVRISLDYYNRKFPAKNINKLFLISSNDHRQDLESLIAEVGLSAQFVDVGRNLGRQIPFSLSLVKGYSISLSSAIKTRVKLDVLAGKAKVKPSKEKTPQEEFFTLFQGIKIDYSVIVLGLLVCAATFGFGLYRTQLIKKGLNNIIAKRQEASVFKPGASYEALNKIKEEYRGKLAELDNLVQNQIFLTEPLNVIPKALPQGMWLEEICFRKAEEGRNEFILKGIVYMASDEKELESVNSLVANLNSSPSFSKYFRQLTIVSLERGEVQDFPVTKFFISCKNVQEKR